MNRHDQGTTTFPPIMQSAEPMARLGRDQKLGLLQIEQKRKFAACYSAKYLGDLEQSVRRFGDNRLAIWRKLIRWFLEKTCSAIWRNRSAILAKTCSAITLEIWRNVVGTVMAILNSSSLWSSIELGNHEWMLNHNRDKMETSYGDQNFIQYKSGEYISGAFQG